MKALTAPMKRVLLNMEAGKEPSHHCQTQSDWGGFNGTMHALRHRGLITLEGEAVLTQAGTDAAKKIKSKQFFESQK